MTEHTPEAQAAYPQHDLWGQGRINDLRTAFDAGRSSMVETVTSEPAEALLAFVRGTRYSITDLLRFMEPIIAAGISAEMLLGAIERCEACGRAISERGCMVFQLARGQSLCHLAFRPDREEGKDA